jgi:hypothetical protein
MITGFAANGVVACVPAPYELLENAPSRYPATRPRNRGNQIPGWTQSMEAVMRKYLAGKHKRRSNAQVSA